MRLLSFFRLSRSFHHEETWLQEFLLLPLATYRYPVTELCFTVTQLCLIFDLKISLAVVWKLDHGLSKKLHMGSCQAQHKKARQEREREKAGDAPLHPPIAL